MRSSASIESLALPPWLSVNVCFIDPVASCTIGTPVTARSCQWVSPGIDAEETLIGEGAVGVLDNHLARLIRRGEGTSNGDRAVARVARFAGCRLALLAHAPFAVRHWAHAIDMPTQHRLFRAFAGKICDPGIATLYPRGCSIAMVQNAEFAFDWG